MRRLTHPTDVALAAWSIAVLAWGGWWSVVMVAALPTPRGRSREPIRTPRVTAIIPAHDEDQLIAATVDSVQASAASLCPAAEVLVVADNCSDDHRRMSRYPYC